MRPPKSPAPPAACSMWSGCSNTSINVKLAQRFVCLLARLRDNQRLGCGVLQPSRMASCFIQRIEERERAIFIIRGGSLLCPLVLARVVKFARDRSPRCVMGRAAWRADNAARLTFSVRGGRG